MSTCKMHSGIENEGARMAKKKNRQIKGKHQAFTARITDEARQALEDEAALNGRTLATEVEAFILEGARARRSARNETDRIIDQLKEEARQIIAENGGLPPSASPAVYAAIVDLLKGAILKLPKPKLPGEVASGRYQSAEPETKSGRAAPSGRRVLDADLPAPEEEPAAVRQRPAQLRALDPGSEDE